MSALAEAMLSAFDSNAKVIWTTAGVGTAIATFTHNGLLVTTTFATWAEPSGRLASRSRRSYSLQTP